MAFRPWMDKLKGKWGISSDRDFWLIMAVFSLAGMGISLCRRPVFAFFGVQPHSPFWLKAAVYVPFVFPLYQFNLLLFGALLGQFGFFWEKEKKLFAFLTQAFRRR